MEKAFKDGTSEIDAEKLKHLQKTLHPGSWGGSPFSNHYPKVWPLLRQDIQGVP
jgi:hypothetical protein